MLKETAEFVQHLVSQSKGFADGPPSDLLEALPDEIAVELETSS